MKLASLDLNLLVLLDALLDELNVTKAGDRVGLSQPAASNALKRLRLALHDPLLEKDGRRLRLTERAHQLKRPLHKALSEVRKALEQGAGFDPETTQPRLRLFASDHIALVLMPALQQRIAARSPKAEIVVHWEQGQRAVELLESGTVDVAIGRYYNTPDAICRTTLYEEELVILARRDHPLFQKKVTAARFASYPRIATSFDGRIFGDQEQAIARAGIEVKAAIVLPHLIAAPLLTLGTELITIAPLKMAKRLSEMVALDWRELPFEALPVPIEMLWHENSAADPALTWFRQVIVEASHEIGRQ